MKERAIRRNSVAGGVAVLTLASVLVKLTGLLYKIPLTYVLGDEGMGYFNAAYTIYAWLYMLSTAGLPIAVSIMVSEARAKGHREVVKRVLRVTSVSLILIGSVTTAFMVIFARQIAALLGTADAYYTMFAIAPTLFFICLTSLFRGIFQGYQNMVPTAVSQLIEAVGKVAVGMGLAALAVQRGKSLPVVSAYAVIGVSAGTLLGTLYLSVRYLIAKLRGELVIEEKTEAAVSTAGIGRRLLTIALPVTVSASVMSLTGLIDLGMIIRRLVSIGYTQAEATALYGNYTTLVVPMFNLPSVLVAPVASGIIPALSAAFSCGDREGCRHIMDGAFRMCAIIAVPAAMGLAMFARPILALLYPAASVETAYQLLAIISPAVYFVCILTVSNAVLQSFGRAKTPMITMLIGGIIKVIAGYVLLGREEIGILGSPIGTVLCYGVALLLNLIVIASRIEYIPSVTSLVWRPLASAVCSIGPAALLYYRFLQAHSARTGTLVCMIMAMALYLIFSLLTGSVKQEDVGKILGRKGAPSRESGV